MNGGKVVYIGEHMPWPSYVCVTRDRGYPESRRYYQRETCRMEPLNAFYTDLNGLNQTEWGVCSNCGTASPIDATYCCECGRKVER